MTRQTLYRNPFMLSGLVCFNSLDWSIANKRVIWLFFIITMFYRNSCFDADQTPPVAASDLSLHGLSKSIL